jgi:hypothetical protein
MNFTPFTNWSRHRLGQPERDEQADMARSRCVRNAASSVSTWTGCRILDSERGVRTNGTP